MQRLFVVTYWNTPGHSLPCDILVRDPVLVRTRGTCAWLALSRSLHVRGLCRWVGENEQASNSSTSLTYRRVGSKEPPWQTPSGLEEHIGPNHSNHRTLDVAI